MKMRNQIAGALELFAAVEERAHEAEGTSFGLEYLELVECEAIVFMSALFS